MMLYGEKYNVDCIYYLWWNQFPSTVEFPCGWFQKDDSNRKNCFGIFVVEPFYKTNLADDWREVNL